MGSMRPARASARLALCVLLAAALVQPLILPSAQAAAPIRMGYIGISSDAGIFIALDKGYFKEQGIELALERFGLGADQMALLGSGRLEIASGALSPTLFNADFQTSLIYYNAQWAREHGDEARRWMTAYVKAWRYYNRAFTDPKVRDEVITILAAHTPVKDRAVYDKMIWPGLNPNGTIAPRTMLDFERWLLNTRQITEFVTPSRFVDESFAQYAAKVLGPTTP
jgi:ABC-type nitrate/sulfonate/bicarbonate transport system substrate-binding protein